MVASRRMSGLLRSRARVRALDNDSRNAPEGAEVDAGGRGWRAGQAVARHELPRAAGHGAIEAIDALLDQVAGLIADDPDSAALLLDEALVAIVEHWYAARGFMAPARRDLLADLCERSAPLAWQLRLALRAPDVRLRLSHVRGLAGAASGQYDSVVACGARLR